MMTERLFDNNGYTRDFTARVLSCTQQNELFDVVLDRTAFFPEEGGQNCDTGTLGNAIVRNVSETDSIIHHYTTLPLEVGSSVSGTIDWAARFRNMQTHSGEHILSGLVSSRYHYHNVGFHLGKSETTVDFDGVLDRKELNLLENDINRIITENHPIHCWYPDPDELREISYRSKNELSGAIRIVQIGLDGCIDSCACCAPHVSRTGEIGLLKILDYEHYKGGTRLRLVCGMDAIRDYQNRYQQELDISAKYSIKQGELPQAYDRMQDKITELQHIIYDLRNLEIENKLAALKPAEGPIVLFMDQADMNQLRKLVNRALPLCGTFCIALSGKEEAPEESYNYIMASEKMDMRAFVTQMNHSLNGRGGGSRQMVQGCLTSPRNVIETWLSASSSQS